MILKKALQNVTLYSGEVRLTFLLPSLLMGHLVKQGEAGNKKTGWKACLNYYLLIS